MGRFEKLGIPDLFDALRVGRDHYKHGVDQALENRDNAIKDSLKSLSPTQQKILETGTDRFSEIYRAEIQKMRDDCTQRIESLRKEVLKEIQPKLDLTRAVLKSQVSSTRKAVELPEPPVSVAEMAILIEKYGDVNYWTDVSLRRIAEESGIDLRLDPKMSLPPSADTILSQLDSVEADLNAMLNDYRMAKPDNELQMSDLRFLSDRRLKRAESMIASGFDLNFTDEQLADRILREIEAAPSVVEQSLMATNAFRGLANNQRLQERLVYKLSKNEQLDIHRIIDDELVTMIEDFRSGKRTFEQDPTEEELMAEKTEKAYAEVGKALSAKVATAQE